MNGRRLGRVLAMALGAASPLAVCAQNAPVPALPAQPGVGTFQSDGVRTIQDAIAALNRGRGGKSAPAQVLGSPAQFFGPDAYPAEAIRSGQEGRSVVRVELDARGFPTGCSVLTSSSSAVLDDATCRIAQTRMQYLPARDTKGKAIASQYTLPVRWVLPRAPEAERTTDLTDGRKALIDVTMEIALDADGKVSSCRTVEQLPALGNPCAAYQVGQATPFRASRNGAASASVMTMMTRMYLDQPYTAGR